MFVHCYDIKCIYAVNTSNNTVHIIAMIGDNNEFITLPIYIVLF